MKSYKVLIVEDENIVAMDLSRRLTNLGYEVVGMASSGKKATQLVAQRTPDIILMDIHIRGDQDGIQVADQINQQDSIPVIFLTAYSEDSTLSRARKTRPYGYLLKPFSERELHVAIQVALERHEVDCQLQRRETHLKLAVDTAKLSTWEIQPSDAPVILAYSPEGRLLPFADWQQLQQSLVTEEQNKIETVIQRLRTELDLEIELEFTVEIPELGQRWYKLLGKSYIGLKGGHRVVGVLQDITEQHQSNAKLKQAAIAYSCSADGIVILDHQGKVESVNRSFTRISGLSEADCEGKNLDLLRDVYLSKNSEISLWEHVAKIGHWQGESSFHRPDGKLIHVRLNVGKVQESQPDTAQFVMLVSDVTPMRDAQQKINQIAYYDTLTGLPNRNLFLDRLDGSIERSVRHQNKFGLLFLDLDHFKRVNDTLGHQVGDRLLSVVAQRLKEAVRKTDTVCRLGGDEFIIIAEEIQQQQDLIALAKKILAQLDAPVTLGSLSIVPGASLGLCIYPDQTKDRDELVKMADIAMYAAKGSGGSGFAVFDPSMSESVDHFFMRDNELRQALKNNQFRLFYQPQYDSRCGRLVGLEALLRWQHPERGILGPGEVIPVAETSNLIVDIGAWVFIEACCQLRSWIDLGFAPARVSVNVSARQLEDRSFAVLVAKTLRHYEIAPQLLDLEITESCLQNSESGIQNLFYLMRMGVSVSIDDFGTGYSCMSSLKTLPITTLKIDRSFVQHIQTDPNDLAIAKAIIALAKQLDLTTIAEGIENQGQAALMRAAGCEEFQGFLYSPPVSAQCATDFLDPAALASRSADVNKQISKVS